MWGCKSAKCKKSADSNQYRERKNSVSTTSKVTGRTKGAIHISRVEDWQVAYVIECGPFPKEIITRTISKKGTSI
jgi:hypothetical protein